MINFDWQKLNYDVIIHVFSFFILPFGMPTQINKDYVKERTT